MNFKKRFVVLIVIIFSIFLLRNSINVSADGFDDVKDVPFTSPINP